MARRRQGGAIPITTVLVGGRSIRVEWKQAEETCRFRIESEEEKTADLRQIAPGVYSIIAGGRSYTARIGGKSVSIDGREFEVEVVDPRRYSREQNHAHSAGQENIVASMPGKVVRVLVAAGDEVAAGQGIVVVEAMKMQNEMKTRRAGRVVKLAAAPGATVTAGDILASIE